MDKLILVDGHKSIELTQYPDEAWTWLTGVPDDGKTGIQDYYKAIPWLFRGVGLRADAVSKMPFIIFSGEAEVDTSDEYQNVIDILPDPKHTLKLIEMSLTLMGMSYLFNVKNARRTLELKYLNPHTIKPKMTEEDGLVGFTRTLTRQVDYPIEDIIYFWYSDPYVEVGPPLTSPAKAALMAAGVLANVDEFVAGFFKRGAIKATILGVPQGASEGARTELKRWWDKIISGIGNAWSTNIIEAESIDVNVIGEGIKELENVTLTREKREDIATALGIPHTLLFSDAANYATARQDDLHFYDKTIVPECWFIQSVLNTQVLEPMGYRLEFQPDTLDVFQEDENERAQALQYLTAAKMPLEVALRTLGFELTDEDWALIEQEREEREMRADAFAENIGGQPEPEEEEEEDNRRSHFDKWKLKATKRLKLGKSAAVDFESEFISPVLGASILGMLEDAKTEDDIDGVFASAWKGYP